jgi:hypothetical protein
MPRIAAPRQASRAPLNLSPLRPARLTWGCPFDAHNPIVLPAGGPDGATGAPGSGLPATYPYGRRSPRRCRYSGPIPTVTSRRERCCNALPVDVRGELALKLRPPLGVPVRRRVRRSRTAAPASSQVTVIRIAGAILPMTYGQPNENGAERDQARQQQDRDVQGRGRTGRCSRVKGNFDTAVCDDGDSH